MGLHNERRSIYLKNLNWHNQLLNNKGAYALKYRSRKKNLINKNDKKMPVKLEDREETRKIVTSIKDKNKRSKNESWDYNKTDWDVT